MTAALVRTPTTTGWRASAACAGVDPELFFPISHTSHAGQLQIAQALNVCAWCPVQPDCLRDILRMPPHRRASQVIGGRWMDTWGQPRRMSRGPR